MRIALRHATKALLFQQWHPAMPRVRPRTKESARVVRRHHARLSVGAGYRVETPVDDRAVGRESNPIQIDHAPIDNQFQIDSRAIEATSLPVIPVGRHPRQSSAFLHHLNVFGKFALLGDDFFGPGRRRTKRLTFS
jgi:hypothetical protein